MPRIDALSIELLSGSAKDKLAEEYGKVIENVQAITLASRLKNTNLSGDPTSGTVEAKRFANSKRQTYGTARAAGKGNNIKADPVVIALDDDYEYIEEVESKDLKTYGVNGLIERRTADHQKMLAVDLDTDFFAEAVNGATAFQTTKSTIEDEIEEAIVTIEKTKNDFVKGVPRNMINVICDPTVYGALRTKINAIGNSQNLVSMANYEEGTFNNTHIFSSVFLPAGTKYVVMVDGSVAQPVMTSIYNPEAIQLSDAIGFGLFTYLGTKTVTPDLMLKA